MKKKQKKIFITVPDFIKATVKYPEQDVIARFNSVILELGFAIKSKTPCRVGIPLSNLFEHVLVTGSTGSGKTYTVAKILRELENRADDVIAVVLDWHGEYCGLVNGAYISPYQAPVDLVSSDYSSLVELLSDVLDLTPPQSFILEKVMLHRNGKLKDIESLIHALEDYEDQSGWMRESRLALLRKLSPLGNSKYSKLFRINISGDEQEREVFNRSILILGLSEIESIVVRRIYSALWIRKIFGKALTRSINKKLVLVIEEAHNYVDREKPLKLISTMLAEVRKFGVGLILVSQSPSKLLEDVMINTNTKIIHSIKSSIDLDIISRVLYLPPEYQRIIPYLDVGEAIVYTRGLKKPLIIRVL